MGVRSFNLRKRKRREKGKATSTKRTHCKGETSKRKKGEKNDFA